jgi:hypothetical protein
LGSFEALLLEGARIGPERARQALALIGELFRIERSIADAPTRKREVVREEQSRLVIKRFFDWCDEQVDQVLDETPIARAIRYARNQRDALSRFLEHGRLPARRVGRWRGRSDACSTSRRHDGN